MRDNKSKYPTIISKIMMAGYSRLQSVLEVSKYQFTFKITLAFTVSLLRHVVAKIVFLGGGFNTYTSTFPLSEFFCFIATVCKHNKVV